MTIEASGTEVVLGPTIAIKTTLMRMAGVLPNCIQEKITPFFRGLVKGTCDVVFESWKIYAQNSFPDMKMGHELTTILRTKPNNVTGSVFLLDGIGVDSENVEVKYRVGIDPGMEETIVHTINIGNIHTLRRIAIHDGLLVTYRYMRESRIPGNTPEEQTDIWRMDVRMLRLMIGLLEIAKQGVSSNDSTLQIS